jgi:hypothetical protein
MEKRRYWNLEEEPLDCIKWINRSEEATDLSQDTLGNEEIICALKYYTAKRDTLTKYVPDRNCYHIKQHCRRKRYYVNWNLN